MTEQENILRNAMADHGGAVYRLALCRLQNIADAEDVYQDVFLRLLEQETADWDSEHTKAWLLRATVNRCADLHRFRLRWPVLSLEEVPELARPVDDGAAELWDAVARLPEKLRTVVHLRPEREQEKICYSEGLTVTVTFADSSEQSKTYRLSAGRLKIVYEEDGTINVLPTLAGDGELCVYGVYAASEEDSRWFRWPVQDSRTVSLSNPYGTVSGKTHNGIDIPAERGSVILAADGTVTETGFDTEKGNYLVLDHRDGLTTLYAHCRDVEAKEGDAVKAGEMIAAVGATGMATGSHLHFEVRQGGEAQDPVAYFDSNLRETLKAE